MGIPTLLVITQKLDPHADALIRILAERGTVRPLRLNSDDFLTNCSYAFRWHADGSVSRAHLACADSGQQAEGMQVGWWRKPGPLQAPAALTHPEAVRIALDEGETLLRLLGEPFPGLQWVNHPHAIRTAAHKVSQIQVATTLGLRIPETLISNRPAEILSFIREYRACIIKPLSGAASYILNNTTFGLYTRTITEADLEPVLEAVQYAPVFVQRQLSKATELRITLCGPRVYACAIEAGQYPHPAVHTDWRTTEPTRIPHRLVQIPSDLTQQLRSILAFYRLNYGAFDIVQEPNGHYIFLELNPNGQYLWIEHQTGAPLSAAMADLIESLAHGDFTPPQASGWSHVSSRAAT